MIAWDKKRFEELEEKIKSTAKGERHMDVPFYRYLYDPSLELVCLKEFKALDKRLNKCRIKTKMISLAALMLDSIKSLDSVDLFFNKEKEEWKSIEEDLKRELGKEILNRVKEEVRNNKLECIILTRAGALFPFVHVSTLLSGMEGEVNCIVVIPYPGNKEGEMLDYPSSNTMRYYRGEVV